MAPLVALAEQRLPQERRKLLQRCYRQQAVERTRKQRKDGRLDHGDDDGGGGSGGSSGDGPSAVMGALPPEILVDILRRLDPPSLGRAACVGVAWRAAAQDDELWEAHCRKVFPMQNWQQQQWGEGGYREAFAAAVAGGWAPAYKSPPYCVPSLQCGHFM